MFALVRSEQDRVHAKLVKYEVNMLTQSQKKYLCLKCKTTEDSGRSEVSRYPYFITLSSLVVLQPFTSPAQAVHSSHTFLAVFHVIDYSNS